MRIVLMASAMLAVAAPAAAVAKPPTRQHRKQYLHDYHQVRRQFGAREAGCDLLERHGSCHVRATDAMLVRSLGVLDRDLAPPPAPPAPAPPAPAPVATADASTQGVQAASTQITQGAVQVAQTATNTAAGGGLEQCIIQHESGGNPQAVSGQYQGIGQWSPEAWAQDGGLQYAASPTGASYAQQQAVLSGEGTAGMEQQQGQYDGCG